jgi:hypothetical protein
LAKWAHEKNILKTAFSWQKRRTKNIFKKQLYLGQIGARKIYFKNSFILAKVAHEKDIFKTAFSWPKWRKKNKF